MCSKWYMNLHHRIFHSHLVTNESPVIKNKNIVLWWSPSNITHLELNNPPDLKFDLLSSSLPGWFSLCWCFLDLQPSAICCYDYSRRGRVTCFSVSDPNRARLLSFQSYFFALRRPAMTVFTSARMRYNWELAANLNSCTTTTLPNMVIARPNS